MTKSTMPTHGRDAAIPLPPNATVPLFYKYSSLATPERVERLRVIIQVHELYLPNLDQLNDPADGRPRLAQLSEEEMSYFLYTKLVQRSPHLSTAELDKEKAIIYYNVKRHGTKGLHKDLTEILHRELKDYRIYSMSKRYDNLSLWAKYAEGHSGYCLEFVNEGPLFERARDVIYEDSLQMDVNNPEHTNGFWFFLQAYRMEQRRGGSASSTTWQGDEGETGPTLVEAIDSRKEYLRAERADYSRLGTPTSP